MEKRIAILRGINVGGRRKVMMDDLKKLCLELDFSDISTYIQSGNVIFNDPSARSNLELSNMIENAIQKRYAFEVPVIVRTVSELIQAVLDNPFYSEEADIDRLYLTFLNEEPLEENRIKTEKYQYPPDEFVIIGKEVFIFCPGPYNKTKLSNSFFENKLKVKATTRNWKTVLKLITLSR